MSDRAGAGPAVIKHGRRRRLADWLTSYMEYTKNTESPRSYHLWGGLSVLANAMERKCYLKWGHDVVRPNQYIILVGPSGAARKGAPIVIARKMMEAIECNLAPDMVTQQRLIQLLATSTRTYMPRPGHVAMQSPISIVVEELYGLLGTRNTDYLNMLTAWWDSRDKWAYETKHQGSDHITNMVCNIYAATAPDWLPSILSQEAMGGGFTSRCIFVVEEKKSQIIPDPNKVMPDVQLARDLVADLEHIRQQMGEFRFTEDGKELYENWYIAEERKNEEGRPTVGDPRFGGYTARRATHVFKISMALSISQSDDMLLTKEIVQRAIGLLELTEKKMPRVFQGLGENRLAKQTALVLELIRSKGQVSRREILSTHYHDVDGWAMDQIEHTLKGLSSVKIIVDPAKRETYYTLVTPLDEDT